ncbi:MAG: hypothetical protein AUK28_00425 [Desulfobacterales bacterium CG2_30_60_27]|nr:MAG: hypothetical protein AUK28_00425 [Desulfobacterales bacterium CG2_30_60_27]
MGLIVLLVVALAAPAGAAGKKKTAGPAVRPSAAKTFDQDMTLSFFREMEARKNFPDSPSFAYYTAYALLTLDSKISPETRKKITDFLASCQKPDGGFAADPQYDQGSNVIYTAFALRTLALLGALDTVDTAKAVGFVAALVNADGGVRARQQAGEKPTLATTAYGVQVLQAAGALDRLNREKTVAFINSCREPGKGFRMVAGGVSSIQATALAVEALQALGAMNQTMANEVSDYLNGTRYAGHLPEGKFETMPALQDMAEVLESLAGLKALGLVDRDKVMKFVLSLYVDENGGFGPQPGLGSTPPSTYYGLVCLVRLGKLPDPYAMPVKSGK